MPRALCEFVDPKLSNIAQEKGNIGQYLKALGQQIRVMLKLPGLICFVT